MDFDNQPIRTDGHGCPRKRSNFIPLAGALARIDNNRQVAKPLHRRNHTQIERVAGVVGESAYPALAQNHVVVAFAHHILGRHQKFFQRRRHATLHHDRPLRSARTPEQRVVLHIARANLNDVGVLLHQVERFMVNGLGNCPQAKILTHVSHDLQAFFAQTLKRIRRCAWLVSSAAKELRPRTLDALSHSKRLLPALNGARPGDNRESRATNRGIAARETNDGVLFPEVAADQLVRLGNADHFLHARHLFQRAGLDLTLISSDADRSPLRPRDGVSAVAERFDLLADGPHLRFARVRLHHHQHEPPRKVQVYRRRRIHRKPGPLAVRRPAPDLDCSLYSLHAPFHCPRAGHPQTAGTQAPASLDLAPHWHSYLHCRRRPECGRTRLPSGLQYLPDFFLQPAPVGAVRTEPSPL